VYLLVKDFELIGICSGDYKSEILFCAEMEFTLAYPPSALGGLAAPEAPIGCLAPSFNTMWFDSWIALFKIALLVSLLVYSSNQKIATPCRRLIHC